MPSRVPKRIVEAPKSPDNESAAVEPLELGAPDRVVARFTRHPRALAAVAELAEQACVRFVLTRLLSFADKDGVCWETVEQLAKGPRSNKVRRYSYKHICRSLNRLRALGLLTWQKVPPFGRWPARDAAGVVQYGEGAFTVHGGRIWLVNVAKLRLAQVSHVGSFRNQAQSSLVGSSMIQRVGSPMIQPSGSRSLSENGLNDPARSRARAALAPTGLDDEPQARPGSRTAPAHAHTPPPAPVRGRYAPAGTAASETPSGSFRAAPAVPQDPRAPTAGPRARAQGEKEHEPGLGLGEWLATLPTEERARMLASMPPELARSMGIPLAPAPPHKAPPRRR